MAPVSAAAPLLTTVWHHGGIFRAG
jgi:hypothetical protein